MRLRGTIVAVRNNLTYVRPTGPQESNLIPPEVVSFTADKIVDGDGRQIYRGESLAEFGFAVGKELIVDVDPRGSVIGATAPRRPSQS